MLARSSSPGSIVGFSFLTASPPGDKPQEGPCKLYPLTIVLLQLNTFLPRGTAAQHIHSKHCNISTERLSFHPFLLHLSKPVKPILSITGLNVLSD